MTLINQKFWSKNLLKLKKKGRTDEEETVTKPDFWLNYRKVNEKQIEVSKLILHIYI